ncbi:uncharacterized protein LOC107613115 isoform X1 [Arachis ipaensis]|uniref:uncharacterized protein LOC107613115 isoform X1 n=1 Tax=Arachis ipaensis TaxID=130454 RepID=UPI000A2B5615|nr:uncharacterized protein LOC107613115 isoform X1 [Arachis ipaensis]XP_020964380.1 uncharacterized protein LOC107613115 isoform X1 [Arachis ipaensis]XP_020964381.1 uncharacterized protein LOC107613115 isoform X1 [Arachis ipaensis]XP_020964382.1 uncharacterized protein LOC107613115 isoform X1 [Arachis ipaensis]XP_025673044.1 uncharacterized protein LOC112772336 isoform X1 [Arachis hypogaea]XP_025673045.1 uncharacterized protein LOC112772336 isoform X1 [Arachis hypogaea]XP_025673046.1 uncharac
MDPPSVFMSNNMWSLLLPEGFQIENLKLGNITFASRDKIFLKGRDTSELVVVYSSYISKLLSRYRGSNNIGALIMEPGFGSRGFAVLIPLISPNSSKGRKKIGPGVYNISTADDAERILTSENKVVLAFLTTLVGSESEELAAASKLEDNYLCLHLFIFVKLVFVHVDMDDEDAGKPIASFFGITGNKISSVVLEGKGVSSSNNLLPKNKMINRILNAQNLQGKLPPELVKLPHLQEMHVINVLFEVVKTALIR